MAMKRYMLVDADKRTTDDTRYFEDYKAALLAVGLKPMEVDFGNVTARHSVIVYEYGLKQPISETKYFAIGRQLFAGNAVLFFSDDMGETVDWHPLPRDLPIRFVNDPELEIKIGTLVRPAMRVNGEVVWEWNKDK